MRRRISNWVLVLLIMVQAVAGWSQIPSALVTRGKRATALVETKPKGIYGSAFCIAAGGFFLTNHHVIAEAAPGDLFVVLNPGELDQKRVPAHVVCADREADLAILKLDQKLNVTPLLLGQDTHLIETTVVTVFGFPFVPDLAVKGQDYPSVSVSTGHITALRKLKGELAAIQIDAVTHPGNSGGPVLNGEGRVIGVLEARSDKAQVSVAIPVSQVKRFLSRPVITLEPQYIAFGTQSRAHDFLVHAVSFADTGDLSVLLTLQSASGIRREFTAIPMGENRYRVTAIPVPPAKSASRLRIRAIGVDSDLTCTVPDIALHVGAATLKLHEIRTIELGEMPQIVEVNGQVLTGKIMGLDGVTAWVNRTTVTLDLSGFTRLTVQDMNTPPDAIEYEIHVKQVGKEIGVQAGALLLEAVAGQGPDNTHAYNPENRHWYQAVALNKSISWTEARSAAERMSFDNKRGHLVTITSAAENQFIVDHFPKAISNRYWIGGYQDRSAPDYREPDGGWRWVTGERWDYTNWYPGEPTNSEGVEDYLCFIASSGQWNDAGNSPGQNGAPGPPFFGFVVEYE